MAFYSYLSTKIIIAFITKSYQDLFGVRSYINALKTKVLEALEEVPFVKKQFQKLADMYGVEIPKIKDYE
jgi:hypothetical protein